MPNQYDHLNLGAVPDAADLLPDRNIALSKHPAETVRVFVAPYGRVYAYGYQVGWADGRSSFRNPSPAIGTFRTETDTILHAIGFFKSFRSYFQPDTVRNIEAAERKYVKPVIPFD